MDDLLIRAFARIRPELYKERRLALKSMLANTMGLTQVRRELENGQTGLVVLFLLKKI